MVRTPEYLNEFCVIVSECESVLVSVSTFLLLGMLMCM